MLRMDTALCIAASFFVLTAAIAADKPNVTGTYLLYLASVPIERGQAGDALWPTSEFPTKINPAQV